MKTLNNFINEALIKKDTILNLNHDVLLWASGECWHILQDKFDKAGYEKIRLRYLIYIVPYDVGIDAVKKMNNKKYNGHVYLYNMPNDFSIDDVNMDNWKDHIKFADKVINSDNRIKI